MTSWIEPLLPKDGFDDHKCRTHLELQQLEPVGLGLLLRSDLSPWLEDDVLLELHEVIKSESKWTSYQF